MATVANQALGGGGSSNKKTSAPNSFEDAEAQFKSLFGGKEA